MQEKGPQGPSFLRLAKRLSASPMGRWRDSAGGGTTWAVSGSLRRKQRAAGSWPQAGGRKAPSPPFARGGGPARGRRGRPLGVFCCLRPPRKIALKLLPLPFPGCRREGLSGPGPTAGLLSCAGKKVTKEARLGGLRRPPKNPREPPVETCGRSMPSSESVAQG